MGIWLSSMTYTVVFCITMMIVDLVFDAEMLSVYVCATVLSKHVYI